MSGTYYSEFDDNELTAETEALLYKIDAERATQRA